MKQSDIKLNEPHVIDPQDAYPYLPPKVRREELVVTPVELGVKLGRNQGVKVRLSPEALAKAREYDADAPEYVTVTSRAVIESVATREQRTREEEAEVARQKAEEMARLERVGQMLDTTHLAHYVVQMSHRPAAAAVDLVGALDNLIEGAQAIRTLVSDCIIEDESAWRARPKRDEDGREYLPTLGDRHSLRNLSHDVGKVMVAAAKYEAHATMLDTLTAVGADFERVKAIRFGKEA